MRRISVWMLILLVTVIYVMELTGVEPDKKDIEAAYNAASSDKKVVTGRIAEATYISDDRFKILLDSEEIGRILYYVSGESETSVYEMPGKTAAVEGELKIPETASNPGVFDYRMHLRSEGIYLIGECRAEEVKIGELDTCLFKGLFINRASVFKHNYCSKMDEVWEGSAGLFSGMLFGDKAMLSEDVYDSFRENGTAHILSVSGLHVGIIYGAVKALMGKRKKSRAAVCIYVSALAACALLASFSVSVMRAATMIVFHMLAEKYNKRYDLISSACVTAIIFLIYRPAMLFNSGFILSFSAVIFLAVVGGGLDRLIRKKNILTGIMAPIVAIQLGMLPINICMFNSFSLAAFLSNIPVIFLASVLIPLGMVGFLLSIPGGIFDILFDVTAAAGGFLGEMLIFFNDFTGVYGRLSFSAAEPSLFLCFVYYMFLYYTFSECSYIKPVTGRKFIILCIAAAIILSMGGVWEKTKPEVIFVDVGQGDCIHIRTPSGKNYLIDGGGSPYPDDDVGEKVLLPYLLGNGVGKLDGIFISHMDADHYKGAAYVNKKIDTGRIFIYEGYRKSEEKVLAKLNADKEDICYIEKGTVIHLDEDVSVKMIFPEETEEIQLAGDGEESSYSAEETDLNRLSAVMLLDYKGTEILLTGDIGVEDEESIKDNCSCDIVKVAHHGSRYSSSEGFVEGTEASAAVIQVGHNYFGHPDETVIERYRKKGIIVFRNDEDGAVLVDIYPVGFEIRGFKGGKNYEF